ncbi:MAG: class I SAM-dependent methyltransferase [Dehalococcoidia bacterium]
MGTDEANRIRIAYARRQAVGLEGERYAYWEPATLYLVQQLEREVVRALARHGLVPLDDRRVLDVGCGDGFWLRFLLRLGAQPQNLYGIDLLPDRIQRGRELGPPMELTVGDASALPYPDASFHLALQFTAFTSVLDPATKRRMAAEMLRVLRPDGVILWYDFTLNPGNPDVRGIGTREVRSLFPGCCCYFRRVTLAPPLGRWLARRSWLACYLLEKVPWLRTHYLATIVKGP